MTTTGDAFGTRSTYGAVTSNGDEIGAEIAPKITPGTHPRINPSSGAAAVDGAGHSAASTTERGAGTRSATRSAHESEAEAEEVPTSSRSEPQRRGRESDEALTERVRSIPFADALAAVVCRLRPEWSPVEVRRWALTDPRGESAVITAGITGAATRSAKYPAGLAQVGPALDLGTVPVPPSLGERRHHLDLIRDNDCGHGDIAEKCALCRHHLPPLEVTE